MQLEDAISTCKEDARYETDINTNRSESFIYLLGIKRNLNLICETTVFAKF